MTAKSLERYVTADVLDYLAVRVDGHRAATTDLSIGVELSDTGEKLGLHLARGVLNYASRPVLDQLLSGELNLDEARNLGQVRTKGDVGAWTAFTGLLDDFSADFPVVSRPLDKRAAALLDLPISPSVAPLL